MRNTLRNTVYGGLASLLVGLSSCGKEQTPAEQFYHVFPDQSKLTETKSVEKYETPGSKHCLVNIRQIHHVQPDYSITGLQELITRTENQIRQERGKVSEEEVLGLEKEMEKTKRLAQIYREQVRETMGLVSTVQRDIYSIILQLKQDCGVTSVRVEGYMLDAKEKLSREMVTTVAQSFVLHGYMSAEEMRDESKYAFSPGGADLLCARGLITIKAGDNIIDYKEREQEYVGWAKQSNSSDKTIRERALREKKRMEEEKENWILNACRTEPASIVVLGGGHDFRNNIEEWNKKHPNDTFSLIVVTPRSYVEQGDSQQNP